MKTFEEACEKTFVAVIRGPKSKPPSEAEKEAAMDPIKTESDRYDHYVTDAEGEDGKPWQDLVARGLARRGPPSELTGGDDVFWCTRELALFVREPDEHLSRGFHE